MIKILKSEDFKKIRISWKKQVNHHNILYQIFWSLKKKKFSSMDHPVYWMHFFPIQSKIFKQRTKVEVSHTSLFCEFCPLCDLWLFSLNFRPVCIINRGTSELVMKRALSSKSLLCSITKELKSVTFYWSEGWKFI